MILVDTSIWIDHFRSIELILIDLLDNGLVLIHPMIIEELACGSLRHRSEILSSLHALPSALPVSHDEVISFITSAKLFGTGIGAVDAHLLASARLAGIKIWSRDKAVCQAAKRLNLLAQ